MVLLELETNRSESVMMRKANELFCSTIKLPSIRNTVAKTSQDVINDPQLEKFVGTLSEGETTYETAVDTTEGTEE